MNISKIGRCMMLTMLMCIVGMTAIQAGEVKSVITAQSPFLLTAAGQTPDVLMVKIIAERQNLAFSYKTMATVADLDGMKTVLLVMGVSMKGLGSAGLNMDQELDRVNALIASAKSRGMKVVGMFAGGAGGRGGRDQITDALLSQIAPEVDQLVVIKTGDKDGFLLNISKQNGIPLYYMNTIVDLTKTVVGMFK